MKVRLIGALIVLVVLGILGWIELGGAKQDGQPVEVAPMASPSDNAFKDLKIN